VPSKTKEKHNVSYMHGLDTFFFLHLIISERERERQCECECVCVCVCVM